jgi:hypothetical protein
MDFSHSLDRIFEHASMQICARAMHLVRRDSMRCVGFARAQNFFPQSARKRVARMRIRSKTSESVQSDSPPRFENTARG